MFYKSYCFQFLYQCSVQQCTRSSWFSSFITFNHNSLTFWKSWSSELNRVKGKISKDHLALSSFLNKHFSGIDYSRKWFEESCSGSHLVMWKKKNHLEHQFEPESIGVPSPAGGVGAGINGCYWVLQGVAGKGGVLYPRYHVFSHNSYTTIYLYVY